MLGLESVRTRLDALIAGTLVWSLAAVDRAVAEANAFGRAPLTAVALMLPEGPALAIVDTWLVHVAVDRVLGGEGALALEARPLSETEGGVFAFIVASTLVGTGAQVAGVHDEGASCAAWLKESPCDRWHWRVQAGVHHAHVTLWVSQQVTARVLTEARSRSARMLPTTLHLRVGQATLSHAEVDQLAVGDVVRTRTPSSP